MEENSEFTRLTNARWALWSKDPHLETPTAVQDSGDYCRASMDMELRHILACGRVRASEAEEQRVVQRVVAKLESDASCHSWWWQR